MSKYTGIVFHYKAYSFISCVEYRYGYSNVVGFYFRVYDFLDESYMINLNEVNKQIGFEAIKMLLLKFDIDREFIEPVRTFTDALALIQSL